MVHFPAENTQPGAVESSAHRHTPGPWAAKYEFGDSISVTAPYRASSEGLPVICDVYSQDGVFEANARLIAAAPDLLEAVSGLLAFTGQLTPRQFIDALYSIDTPGLELCDREDLIGKLDAAQAAAWTAIAKATTAPSMGNGDE